jgi:hypothetical protein
MNSPSLAAIQFRRSDHFSALWWLGLVYRRPEQFQAALLSCSARQQLITAFCLLVHGTPYVLAISVASRLLVANLFGLEIQLVDVARGVAVGITIGIVGGLTLGIVGGLTLGIVGGFALGILGEIAMGIAGGIAGGIVGENVIELAFWIIFGVAGGIAFGTAVGTMLGIAFGRALGKGVERSALIALGITGGIGGGITVWRTIDLGAIAVAAGNNSEAYGITLSVVLGIVFGIVSAITSGFAGRIIFGIAGGIAVGIDLGIVGSIVFGTAFALSLSRIYYHLAHPFFLWPRIQGRWYPHHPVAWDDLCGIPFLGLDRLLVDYAEKVPESGVTEIVRISSYASQRMMALRAKVRLAARESGKITNLALLDQIVAALPEGEKGFMAQTGQLRAGVHKIATLQSRLNTIDRAVFREPFAELLLKEIENFRHRIGGFHEPLATEFRTAAGEWLNIAEKQFRAARAVVGKEPVAQVFRAGDPVDNKKEAFVSRDSVIGDLQAQVLLSAGCPGIVLYGRRRVGKSTVLQNLSGFLPSTVRTVKVSMQNPEASTSLSLLAEHLFREVSRVFTGESLSSETPKDLKDLFCFLSKCNQLLTDDQRLLISVDEYENIDEKIGQGIFPKDLLAMFRESIQSHRRIMWLFAGSHEITELVHAPWTSYFVSVRTVEVPLFSEQETRLLLTNPLQHSSLWLDNDLKQQRPHFESGFWGEGGIERIHAEAGGWPHLVQLIAETIVDLLNKEGRWEVAPPLLERALDRAVVSGHNVLYELLHRESSLAGEWDYLSKFRSRETQPPPDAEAIVVSLRRRLLVDEEPGQLRLRVPLMSRWLRQRG